jgi:multidrug efflux pump subunit AcrB
MKAVISWFAENSVAANLTMLVIVAGGLITVGSIRKEVFPEIEANLITISVTYRGAAPQEVEEAVCVRIEEEIYGVEGIKKLTSTAAENIGVVTVEVQQGYDVRRVLDDVKNRVDAIDTFPAETEKPIVREVVLRRQVLNVAIHGPADERTLKRLGERVRDEIGALPGITQVELANARPYEISIEVSEDALRRHGLTFDQVVRAVRQSSLDLPGGALRTDGGEILLRSKGQAYRGEDFERIVLLTRPDGTYLRVGDIATVVDGFEETDQSARFDGQPSVLLQVFRVGDQSALDIAGAVKEYASMARARMPEGIRLTVWQDDSRVLQSRLDLLLRNGMAGFVLVFVTLALFLKLRLAFWVSLGIPVSFLGALWLMPGFDISINLMSLFAFIVVLGIVVDDAIVVGESIYTAQRKHGPGLQAAVAGAHAVYVPVIFAVLTTMAAFSPLLFLEGSTGKIARVIPLIVIPTLVFSLIESLLVLPAHLSFGRGRRHTQEPERGGVRGWWKRFRSGFSGGLDRFVEQRYRPALARAIRWRYLTFATGAAILILTIGVIGGGWVRFSFFPPVEAENVAAMLTMPQGTPAEVTADAVRVLESTALDLRREIDGDAPEDESVFRHLLASVGEQPFRTMQSQGGGNVGRTFVGGHLGEVNIQLAPSEERTLTSTEIASRWRLRVGSIPDAVELSFTSSLFSTGEAINIQLTGPDLERLRASADALKAKLAEYPGVFDIADSFRAGKRELTLAINPSAETLGLSLADLARQVRQGFYGEEAQRIQRGRDDVRVMVRYPAEHRRSLGDLENMRIRTPAGQPVAFGDVAVAGFDRGFDAIRRTNRQRAVNVTADVDLAQGDPNDILANVQATFLPALLAQHPGVQYSLEGEQQQQRETLSALGRGFTLALVAIFALLAIPLRSYVQPILIMLAIPFGLIGAVLGHLIMGLNLTVLSMFGIVALAGVVVNASLVLVDFINRGRAMGMSPEEAAVTAGAARFRAIMLTSLTTFAGLTPLMLERSMQAQFLIPMAISLAFGVIVSAVITLMLVPASYVMLEDIRALLGSGREPVECMASDPVVPDRAERRPVLRPGQAVIETE